MIKNLVDKVIFFTLSSLGSEKSTFLGTLNELKLKHSSSAKNQELKEYGVKCHRVYNEKNLSSPYTFSV